MSQKNLDRKKRFRSVTVSFRMSEAERDLLNTQINLSGLNKQDYLIRRALKRDIEVVGSPRVYKAIREELKRITEVLVNGLEDTEEEEEMIEKVEVMIDLLREIVK